MPFSELNHSIGVGKKFEEALEAMPTAMMLSDQNGRIHFVNRQAAEIFGYTKAEFLKLGIDQLVPEKQREGHPELRSKYFESPVSRPMGTGRELFAVKKCGTEFEVEIGLTPLELGKGLFVLTSVTDISKRKAVERELKQRTDEMKRFVYTVSHDLKAPIASGKIFLGFIKEDKGNVLSPRSVNDLEHLNNILNKMAGLIQDVLKVSRLGFVEYKFQTVSLSHLIQEVLRDEGLMISERKVKVQFAAETFPVVVADPDRLKQGIDNLLLNALDHGCNPESPAIEITFQNTPETYQICVQDNGTPLEQKFHEKIFQIFTSLDKTKKENSGLGLAIVKKVAEIHKGKAWVEALEGVGNRFFISISKSLKPLTVNP